MIPDRSRAWLTFRIALLAFSFVAGILTGVSYRHLPAMAKPPLALIVGFGVFGLMMMPLFVVPVIALQAVNPLSDSKWSPPRHDENPFRLGNPLRALHLVAFQLPVMGMGTMASSIWVGYGMLLFGLLQALGGASVYVGLLLSMRVCKHKMRDH